MLNKQATDINSTVNKNKNIWKVVTMAHDLIISTLAQTGGGGGLTGMKDTLINNWIQPVFLVAVAAFALIFVKDRAWMKLLAFLVIAAIVGVVIFFGGDLFGSSGNFTNAGKGLASTVNLANAPQAITQGIYHPTLW